MARSDPCGPAAQAGRLGTMQPHVQTIPSHLLPHCDGSRDDSKTLTWSWEGSAFSRSLLGPVLQACADTCSGPRLLMHAGTMQESWPVARRPAIAGAQTPKPNTHAVAPRRYTIQQHPEVEAKLLAELDAAGLLVTADRPHPRPMEYADLGRLTYLTWVCKVRNFMVHGFVQGLGFGITATWGAFLTCSRVCRVRGDSCSPGG